MLIEGNVRFDMNRTGAQGTSPLFLLSLSHCAAIFRRYRMKSEYIINQASVEIVICEETHTIKSNLVKVKIKRNVPVNICLQGKKIVCGSCLRAGQFEFVVFDQNKKEVARARNDKHGDIDFPALTLEQAGVYTYTMREISRPQKNWMLDRRHYSVIVTVSDCGQGRLTAVVSYPKGLPVFVNRYCPQVICDAECWSSDEPIYLPHCHKRG